MKITDSDNIKNGEKDLIDTIVADLDWSVVEQIVREKHKLALQDDVDYTNGDIIVHEDQIAYKLDFDVKVKFSILCDRNGDCLDLKNTPLDFESEEENNDDVDDSLSLEDEDAFGELEDFSSDLTDVENEDDALKKSEEKISKMASNIADMITEINED